MNFDLSQLDKLPQSSAPKKGSKFQSKFQVKPVCRVLNSKISISFNSFLKPFFAILFAALCRGCSLGTWNTIPASASTCSSLSATICENRCNFFNRCFKGPPCSRCCCCCPPSSSSSSCCCCCSCTSARYKSPTKAPQKASTACPCCCRDSRRVSIWRRRRTPTSFFYCRCTWISLSSNNSCCTKRKRI